jgi:uncharacterized protein YcsI (UPF0317 family)
VILPREWAYDFLVFAQRNPKPCPILDVTEPGDPEPKLTAPGADLRTDLPKYRIWKEGQLIAEPEDIREYWRDDLVAFLLGCSFSFEGAPRGRRAGTSYGTRPERSHVQDETFPACPRDASPVLWW